MKREQWLPFLKRWSEEWIVAHDPERDMPLDEAVVREGWLGFAPASTDAIAAAEARLGRPLPPSLREFLLVTDGWRDAGNFIYRLAGAAELDWLRETDDAHWIEAYGGDEAEEEEQAEAEDELEADEDDWEAAEGRILRRSLRISLDGDAAVMLLDPHDVDEHGEWAGYWLASWSGMGPERHDSFYDLMRHQYTSFHSLRKPAGATRDHWDEQVGKARIAALDGQVDGPLEVLREATEFGLQRARLMRFQLLAMSGDWHTVPLSVAMAHVEDLDAFARDPFFTAELLPLLFSEDRLAHHHECFTVGQLRLFGPESVRRALDAYEARLRDAAFRPVFGNPEFDAAVRRVLALLDTAAPTGGTGGASGVDGSGRPAADAAWAGLREAMALWRPVSEDHIAPVVLFADPALAALITPQRGRELLESARG